MAAGSWLSGCGKSRQAEWPRAERSRSEQLGFCCEEAQRMPERVRYRWQVEEGGRAASACGCDHRPAAEANRNETEATPYQPSLRDGRVPHAQARVSECSGGGSEKRAAAS